MLLHLRGLARDLRLTVQRELEAKLALQDAETCRRETVDRLVAAAFANGEIDGKNAEHRTAQVGNLLALSMPIAECDDSIHARAKDVATRTAARAGVEAEIGLLKAWLHSRGSASLL